MRRRTTEEFIELATKVHNGLYDYSLVDYYNKNTLIKIICPVHGIFTQIPHNHLKGMHCGKCNGTHLATNDEFIARSKQIHGEKFDYSKVDYIGLDHKITLICSIHGAFSLRAANHIYRKTGCRKCADEAVGGMKRKSLSQFIAEASKLHHNKYDYSNVIYKRNSTKVKILCPIHGIFIQVAGVHLAGHGCPACSAKGKSKKEYFIHAFLQNKNVSFQFQYINTMCKDKQPLLFDFVVFNNNKVVGIIEYDGEQHFRPVQFGGMSIERATKQFKSTQKHDKIKNDFCGKNNIPLLRIPYTETAIEETILKWLDEIGYNT